LKKIALVYFLLLSLITYIPNWDIIDAKGTHWLALGILNTVTLINIFFFSKNQSFKFHENKIFQSFLIFFLISLMSLAYALNPLEGLTKITDLFSLLTSLIIVLHFIDTNSINRNYLLYLILLSLTIDITLTSIQYFTITNRIDFTFEQSNLIRGMYGNKNIASVSILLKLILSQVLIQSNKSVYLKYYVLTITTISFYALFLLSSRTVFLAMIVSLVFLISVMLLKKLFYGQNIKNELFNSLNFMLPLILSLIFFSFSSVKDDQINLQNRVSSMVEFEGNESVSQRIRFYSSAFKYIKTNPFFGTGIGNWRILSIKYDSQYIFSYVVPYFAHNDFIEILAEIGIFGFLAYLMFFFFIFKLNFKKLLMWMKNKAAFESIILIFFIITYIIDANLNFPLDRPAIQTSLIIYITILLIDDKNINLNESK
jgi:O-antigen ligase